MLVLLPCTCVQQDVEPPKIQEFMLTAQPLLAMDGSDAMALSMIVSIFDRAYIYVESMKTAETIYLPLGSHTHHKGASSGIVAHGNSQRQTAYPFAHILTPRLLYLAATER